MNGQLFIAGRIKDLIIIRGANHHPQDIEWTVQASHPAMRPEAGAAFSVVIEGDEKLVVAQEVEREYAANLQAEGIARVVRQAITESHDLDLFALLLLARGSLPKTASGKIQRQACRSFFLQGGPQVLGRWVAPTSKAPHCQLGCPRLRPPTHNRRRSRHPPPKRNPRSDTTPTLLRTQRSAGRGPIP